MPKAIMRFAIPLPLAGPSAAAEPVLGRVTLASGGVEPFEFTAHIGGAATLSL